MSVIRLNNVTQRYEQKLILRNVYFTLSRGERVGLIGRNGAGKTTVLKLMLGQEEPSEGTVEVEPGLRMGYFSQFSELNGAQSVREVLEALFADIHALERELRTVEAALDPAPGTDALQGLLRRQAQLLEEMERREGWTYRYRIDTVLSKLGFGEPHRSCPIEQLSGGWRNRAALARLLLTAPDVLLLDEPTNFLDIEGLLWLESWIGTLRGALVVVSHDRHFINQVANRIVEIQNYQLQEYAGDFEQYVREKAGRLKVLERQFEHEEELLAYEAEAIADRRAVARDLARDPGRARAQALKRRLASIKKAVQPRPVDQIVTDIYRHVPVHQDILLVEHISKAYGAQMLFRNLSFDVQRGERLVIVGPNGCGKTTLLRVLTGEESPDEGRAVWKSGIACAYYNQIFAELDLDDTVTHAVNVYGLAYRAPRKQVNRFLGLLQFSEMDLNQKIGTLSGGQRARVALAKCQLSGLPAIVLDEPTNHLDLPSTQVMERSLIYLPGAVIVVSHDRFFIDKVATRLLVFEGQGRLRDVWGNWTIWQASLDAEKQGR